MHGAAEAMRVLYLVRGRAAVMMLAMARKKSMCV